MGIFFQKRKKKSGKIVSIVHLTAVIAMVGVILMAILDGFKDLYFIVFFVVAGINSAISGLESYTQKDTQKVYLPEFVMGIIFLLMASLW